MAKRAWSSRTFSPMTEPWPSSGDWIAEWMTLDDETWYTRISPAGDPGLPPIVMIHGLVVSGAYFRPVAERLDTRYAIYVPDLPGYGRSTSGRFWTLPSITTRLSAWMDAHGLRNVVLVGNSLGCQIATLLATERPELVGGMVLVAPTLDPDIRNTMHLMVRGALDIPRERQSLWSVWVPDLFRAGPRRALAMLHQTMLDGHEQLTRLPNVHQPALLVGGEEDPVAPPRWIENMEGRMPAAKGIILPNSPHAMNYSSPDSLARAIDRVIEGRTLDDRSL